MKKFLDKLSDTVTDFIGSWYFITLFFAVLFGWMAVQTLWPVDLYPYILLNLVLSTLAAVQGAIIMMSQKRQESKDRELMREMHQLIKNCESYVQKVDNSNIK